MSNNTTFRSRTTCADAFRAAHVRANKTGQSYYVIGDFFDDFRVSWSPKRDASKEPKCYKVSPRR